MDVVVNGTQRDVPTGSSAADLVFQLGFGAKTVVVELNGEPVHRDKLGETKLRNGDRVEVVRAVPGG